MHNFRFLLSFVLFFSGTSINATPVIKLSEPENYCVVHCYLRNAFIIKNIKSGHRIGRIFCDFDVDVISRLPVYQGEAKKKTIIVSSIGVFKIENGTGIGDVEISTGINKGYFVNAILNKISCHL